MGADLPPEWRRQCLGDVAKVVAGQSPPGSTVEDWDGTTQGTGLPFIQGNAEFGDRSPHPTKWCTMPAKRAEAGDTLLSVRAPVGETNRANTTLAIGRGVVAIRFWGVTPEFGWHALNRAKRGFEVLSQGSTFSAITGDVIRRLELVVPPPAEQRIVAAALDAVDEAIARTAAGIAAVERLYEALSDELLSRGPAGLHSQWRQVAGLGKVPACWEPTTVGACLATSPANGIYKPASDRGAGVVLIRILDFGRGRMHRRSGFDRVQATPDEALRYEVKAGDILVNRVNSGDNVAKAVLFPDIREAAVFESNMMRLRVNGKVNPRFLEMHLVGLRARTHFRARTKKAVQQASVNQQDVVSLPIALPSLSEQAAICATVESVRQLDDQAVMVLRAFRAAKSAISESLLSGRVRVPNLAPPGLGSDAGS